MDTSSLFLIAGAIIFRRFEKKGIEIPFHHRTVYLREEKEWKR